MNRLRHPHTLVYLSFALTLLASSPGHAGLTDALKKKITDKATKKAEDAVDKVADKPEKAATSGEKTETGETEKVGKGEAAAAGGGARCPRSPPSSTSCRATA